MVRVGALHVVAIVLILVVLELALLFSLLHAIELRPVHISLDRLDLVEESSPLCPVRISDFENVVFSDANHVYAIERQLLLL